MTTDLCDIPLTPKAIRKALYLEVYYAAMAKKKEWGVEFEPRVLWWPTPKSFFQRFRGCEDMFFLYAGKDKRLIRLNEKVRKAWEHYMEVVV